MFLQMAVADSPVLSTLPAGLCISIFSWFLFSLPPWLFLSLFALFLSNPLLFHICCSPGLSASLSYFLCTPLHSLCHVSSSSSGAILGNLSSGVGGGGPCPGGRPMPCHPLLSLCPVSAAGRVGKGQRVEAVVAQPGAQLWLGKKGGKKELGD